MMIPMLQIILITTSIGCALIAWAWLLHFPWGWFLTGFAIAQALFVGFIIASEHSASFVNGASGWMFVFFCFVQGLCFLLLGVLRLGIFIGQVFNWIVL